MFGSKKCPRCNKEIKESFGFCPNCGKQLKSQKEDWGILGKNDFLEEHKDFQNNFFGGITGNMLEKMLGSTVKMLEKEFQKETKKFSEVPETNAKFELFINGRRISPRNIHVTRSTPQEKTENQQQIKKIYLPYNKLKKFSELPQEEPATNIRRLADIIIYEINLPGVKTEKEISIQQIGEVIEIKAIAKTKAYMKTITLNLPIAGYKFSRERLILELEVKN